MLTTFKKNEIIDDGNAKNSKRDSSFEETEDNYPVNNSGSIAEPHHGKEFNIDDVEFPRNHANSHLNDTESKEWMSPFTVKKSWNYRTVLNEKKPKRPKINSANQAKSVKMKKPRVSIPHNLKNDNSSPYHRKMQKKRPKKSKNDSKSLLQNYRDKMKLVHAKSSTVNGLLADEKSVASRPKIIEVPDELAAKETSYDFDDFGEENAANEEDEDDVGVPQYPQYVELKPSVRFKCYRCGMKDFSTMALLHAHMGKCSGKTNSNNLSHSSSSSTPLRTTKERLISTPLASPDLKITRKVFLCSSCGTYYQNYNLYIHMRDKHNKQICLYCRNIFSRSDQLWDHLVNVHNLDSVKFSNVSEVRNVFKSSFYITCCSCNSIFSEEDRFNEHNCESRLNGNDIVGTTVEKEGAICLGCKSKDETEAIAGVNDNSLPDMEIRRSSTLHKSVYSDEETDSEITINIPRESTLDVIGVPENHTVSSFDEAEPVSKTKDQPEYVKRIPTPVPNDYVQSPIPEDHAQSPVAEVRVQTPVSEERIQSPVPEDRVQTPVPGEHIQSPVPEDRVQTLPVEHVQTPLHDLDDSENGTESENVENRSQMSPLRQNVESPLVPPSRRGNTVESDTETDILNVYETKPTRSDYDDRNFLLESTTVKTPDSRSPSDGAHVTWSEETKSTELPNEKPQENETSQQPLPMALMLDDAVASLSVQALIMECVRTSCLTCLYCNNATLIAVNASHLIGHLVSGHRYMPTKNEDDSQKVVEKLESGVNDFSNVYMNASHSTHHDIKFEGSFACLQCSFSTTVFKDLCHHKRRSHHTIIFLCIMCKCSFLYYSQLLCHLCPGLYSPETQHSLNYQCCFCNVDRIPSAFRLMVHLRKAHRACDVCLSQFADQSELHSHILKQHKINHLCYKCNLAWRSRDDISKHLFWKHGTESVLCKRCLQKKWPHAYHFCIPASKYTCDECNRIFTRAVALTVHRRAHKGEFPFGCEDCEKRFISKRLVALHRRDVHHVALPQPAKDSSNASENQDNAEGTRANGPVNGEREESKSRRKKKRKKTKVGNEKPLLDELPPLNLSSESDDETPDEDNGTPTSTNISTNIANPSADSVAAEDTVAAADTAPAGDTIVAADTASAKDTTAIADSVAVVDTASAGDTIATADTASAGNTIATADAASAGSTIAVADAPSAEDTIAVADTSSTGDTIAVVDATSTGDSATETVATPDADTENEKPADTLIAFSLPPLDEVPRQMNEFNPITSKEENTNGEITTENASSNTVENPVSEIEEEKSVNMVEKMLNCLIIEHSYCIPDSIFRTEMNHSAVSESSDNANKQSSSPKPCTKRDKSCKSVTPRKRKRSSKRESSSSDSSSDSDSSSSSCGSNCSCNKSASNCSSSSSSESTTPEKSAKKSKAGENRSMTEEGSRTDTSEQQSLLNVAESDLETEIVTSDEDFYEVHPFVAPPPQPATVAVETRPNQVTCPTFDTKITISKEARAAAQSTKEKKTRKRKKKPRITINLGQIQRNSNAAAMAKSLAVQSLPQNQSTPYGGYNQPSASPSISALSSALLNSSVPNCVNSTNSTISSPFAGTLTSGTGSDTSGRLSKRKRVKNKFYGYSSSDDGSTNESFKSSVAPVRKRVPQHKRQPKHPFVGIQIKKPLLTIIPPKPYPNSSSTMPPRQPGLVSRPTDMYRVSPIIPPQHHYQQHRPQVQLPDTFRQQHGFAKPLLPHSSDESSDDSDERRHTLVINLPNPRQKKMSYRPPPPAPPPPQQTVPSSTHYPPSNSDSLRRPQTWMAARTVGDSFSSAGPLQHHAQSTPNKSEIYCFCKCPYDEVSEMIGCDGPNCPIEWFHFECVGIMVPPKGKWFCPECRKNRENVTRFFD